MVKRNYELPEKVIEKLSEFTENTSMGLQRIIGAGAILLVQLDPAARERVMTGYANWLKGKDFLVAPHLFPVDEDAIDKMNRGQLPPLMNLKDAVDALVLFGCTLTENKWNELVEDLASHREEMYARKFIDEQDREGIDRLNREQTEQARRKRSKEGTG